MIISTNVRLQLRNVNVVRLLMNTVFERPEAVMWYAHGISTENLCSQLWRQPARPYTRLEANFAHSTQLVCSCETKGKQTHTRTHSHTGVNEQAVILKVSTHAPAPAERYVYDLFVAARQQVRGCWWPLRRPTNVGRRRRRVRNIYQEFFFVCVPFVDVEKKDSSSGGPDKVSTSTCSR